jgi:forkhead box protein K
VQNSVRHNLSSGKTFKKMERSQGERGKGYYWSIDENYEHIVLEQDAKLEQTLSAANREKVKKNKGPLPPPLTSQPLASKTVANPNGSLTSTFRALPISTTATVVKVEHTNHPFTNHTLQSMGPGIPYPSVPASALSVTHPTQTHQPPAPVPSSSSHPTTGGKAPGIPAIVRIPIIVGPVPDSYVPSSTSELSASTSPHLPTPPIVLHENTLILNPTIFGHLTSEQLKGLETLGAQKALEILQGYIVRFLKERMKTESGKGRGRGGTGVRGRGRGRGGIPGASAGRPQVKAEDGEGSAKRHIAASQPVTITNPFQPVKPQPGGDDEDAVVDIEGDTDDTERASKRRRVDDHTETEAGSDSSATVVPRQGSPPMASLA